MNYSIDYRLIIISIIAVIAFILVYIGIKIYLTKKKVERDIGEKGIESIIADFGYAYDENQDIFYSILNSWQRKYGYCKLYDESAQSCNMLIDCEPIYFKYDGRYWLIEFWKGQYGITTGCEVGVYVSNELKKTIIGDVNNTLYSAVSDDELLNLSCTLRKNGQKLFTRQDLHWWLTGFRLGDCTSPSELDMDISIEFKNKEMLKAFIHGLKEVGYNFGEYEIVGKVVNIKYNVPKSRQPHSRGKIRDKITLAKCKFLCKRYMEITSNYPDMENKLLAIKDSDLLLLSRIIYMSRNKNLYN